MNATAISRAMAHRTPLISFVGKRSIPQNLDHTPRAHPQAPTKELPDSFAEYRKNALQHGPLASHRSSIVAAAGEYFDRNQLPKKFWRMTISKEEMELIESGGAAAWA
ncbi:hypothetical protein BDD12DRAFT_873367 [Trichophaea hybrida]|nr:hypothetical protein BDD12DRAFT_873367 [Trichophaea hybrida]